MTLFLWGRGLTVGFLAEKRTKQSTTFVHEDNGQNVALGTSGITYMYEHYVPRMKVDCGYTSLLIKVCIMTIVRIHAHNGTNTPIRCT